MNQTIAQTPCPLTSPAPSNKPASLTGRQSLDAFFALCEAAGARCYLSWRWAWPNRSGVLNVLLDDGHKHLQFHYYRGRTGWRDSDDNLHRLHTGSARHHAVLEAIGALKQYLAERA